MDPYDGIDAYAVIKAAYWLDDATQKQVAPYVEIIPAYTSEGDFWWQRNAQVGVGFQYYPLSKRGNETNPWRGIRFFGLAAWRTYYDRPDDADSQDNDLQAGADYYYDNILKMENILTVAAFANAGYRKTNFALDDYSAFTCFGNVKVGPKVFAGKGLLFPYLVGDWSYSPSHDDRWWENYIRGGGGVAWYPLSVFLAERSDESSLLVGIGKRLNVFVEGLAKVADLGDATPDVVEDHDFRAGISLATGGFFGE